MDVDVDMNVILRYSDVVDYLGMYVATVDVCRYVGIRYVGGDLKGEKGGLGVLGSWGLS